MVQQVIHDDIEIAVGALAANAVVVQAGKIDSSLKNGVRIKKMKYVATYVGHTAGEGPMMLGLAVDHDATEIKECLEADPQGPLDSPGTEQGNRRVYPLEWWPEQGTGSTAERNHPFKHVRMPWKEIPEGSGINWFVWTDALLTTGMVVNIKVVYVLEWLRD